MNKGARPLVSFVIPTFNHANYIGESIESVLNQRGNPNFEIVLVNDGSTDDTMQRLEEFSDPRLRVLHLKENRGHVAAINIGAGAVRGAFVARQDTDNRYRPDFLQTALDVFEQNPQVGIVYGDVAAIDGQGHILADPWDGVRSRVMHQGKAFCGNEFIPLLVEYVMPIVAMLMRREVWDEAFPLPAWLPRSFVADDWFASTRMFRRHEVSYVPHVFTEYRLHPQNLHRRFEQGAQQEVAMLRTLDEIFADPERHAEKEQVRRTAYAGVYAMLAPRYLGAGNLREARRCYVQAFRYAPKRMLDGYAVRGFLHTLLGTPRYEAWKARLRAA